MTTLVEREICSQNLEDTALQNELTWGLSYRVYKEGDQTAPVKPKHSPINVPFKICRANSQKTHKNKKKCNCFSYIPRRTPKLSLVDRTVLNQDRYMNMLSVPIQNTKQGEKKMKEKRMKTPCCKCLLEPCSPRLIQMAVPNKRLVLETWKAYEHFLPAEVLMRFDQILKSGNNLEPREARYYFKQLNKQKRKEIKRRKKICRRKKKAITKKEKKWLKDEIAKTAEAIVDFVKNEPLFKLNFQQMMTSDELINYLISQKVIKIKSRNTKSVYKRSVIDISDKLVKWMDALNFFTDIQPLDSKEKLLEMPSLESMLLEEEEEGEEGEEGEFEEEEAIKGVKGEEDEDLEDLFGGEDVAGGDATRDEEFLAQKLLDKTKEFEDHEEGSILDYLGALDENMLEKLIQILSVSPEDFLSQEVDPENLPGVTYKDILDKLKEIRDGNLLQAKYDKIFLEEKMVEWAKHNEPESIDDKLLDKIHETSNILMEFFKDYNLGQIKPTEPSQPTDEVTKALEDLEEHDEYEGAQEVVEETIQKTIDTTQEARPPVTGTEGDENFQEALESQIEAEKDIDEGEVLGEVGEGEDEAVKPEDGGEMALGDEGEGMDEEEGEEGFDEHLIEGGADEMGEQEGEDAFGGKYVGEGEEYGEDELLREMEHYGAEGYEALGEEVYPGLYSEEEGFGEEYWPGGEEEGFAAGEEEEEGFAAGEGEEEGFAAEEDALLSRVSQELERIDTLLGVIRGHKPPVVYEHQPGTICCLSLKIWAVWLLEIANNAHNWTRWIGDIIKQVRGYASIIRGDVTLPNGQTRVLHKEEWRKFVRDTEEKVIAWRQYSKHVKDLSKEIMDTFHQKKVICCPKCLQDHLIKNVVTAHETLQALTEAINCAGYWQRCLDTIVEQTSRITDIDASAEASGADTASQGSNESCIYEIEELLHYPRRPTPQVSDESVYEIVEVPIRPPDAEYVEIVEMMPKMRPMYMAEVYDMSQPSLKQPSSMDTKLHKKKSKTKAQKKKGDKKKH